MAEGSSPGGERGALRVLVLSVDIGAGHKMAGQAVCAALERRGPLEVEWVEALDYMGSEGGKRAKDTYFKALRHAPELWGAVYEIQELGDFFRPFSEQVDGLRIAALVPRVQRFKPDLMLAVHPFGCGLAGALRREGAWDCPLAAVLTDFDAHMSWVARGVNLYCCATAEIAAGLEALGLPSGRALATGLPIREPFWGIRDLPDPREELGLQKDLPVVLLLGGGLGLGPIVETVAQLVQGEQPLQAVVIAGRNQALREQAEALVSSARQPLIVRGFVDDMHAYLRVADLGIGKPGGSTCAEMLAAGVPLIALAPIPGQERANSETLSALGVAREAATPQAAVALASELLAQPERLKAMRRRALEAGRPQAANAVAAALLALHVSEQPARPTGSQAVLEQARQLAREAKRRLAQDARALEYGTRRALRPLEDLTQDAKRELSRLWERFQRGS